MEIKILAHGQLTLLSQAHSYITFCSVIIFWKLSSIQATSSLSKGYQASVAPQFHPDPKTSGGNPPVTGCFSTHYCPSRESLPVDSLSLSLSSARFLIGWGNVGNFMWSLSQLPGCPHPPLAVRLPRRACRQAVRPGGVQLWEGVPSQGTGGLGKLKALLTAGQGWDWRLGAVRHWTLPKRGGNAFRFGRKHFTLLDSFCGLYRKAHHAVNMTLWQTTRHKNHFGHMQCFFKGQFQRELASKQHLWNWYLYQ